MLTPLLATGQNRGNIEWPIMFGQWRPYQPFFNPASVGQYDWELGLGSQRQFGAWTGVHTNFAYGTFTLGRKNGHRQHLGLRIYNDQEGEFIQRNRAYFSYGYSLPLSETVTVRAAASLGGLNYAVQGTNVSGSGSDLVPDADLGFWLSLPRWDIGLAAGQLLQNQVIPYEQPYRMVRTWHLNAIAQVYDSEEWQIWLQGRTRLAYDLPSLSDVGMRMRIGQFLHTSAHWRVGQTMIVGAGLEGIEWSKSSFDLLFSYQFPFRADAIVPTNSLELTLVFRGLWNAPEKRSIARPEPASPLDRDFGGAQPAGLGSEP